MPPASDLEPTYQIDKYHNFIFHQTSRAGEFISIVSQIVQKKEYLDFATLDSKTRDKLTVNFFLEQLKHFYTTMTMIRTQKDGWHSEFGIHFVNQTGSFRRTPFIKE